jgi:hypothetical protein
MIAAYLGWQIRARRGKTASVPDYHDEVAGLPQETWNHSFHRWRPDRAADRCLAHGDGASDIARISAPPRRPSG